ncbi:hypothetical protein F4780DRAFT_102223 [Xylariomycetidae sp. FL0641]|nr:hypothetical protein F4780DRAFT_102223 [Xylariomycetidae sp. FL0641]
MTIQALPTVCTFSTVHHGRPTSASSPHFQDAKLVTCAVALLQPSSPALLFFPVKTTNNIRSGLLLHPSFTSMPQGFGPDCIRLFRYLQVSPPMLLSIPAAPSLAFCTLPHLTPASPKPLLLHLCPVLGKLFSRPQMDVALYIALSLWSAISGFLTGCSCRAYLYSFSWTWKEPIRLQYPQLMCVVP